MHIYSIKVYLHSIAHSQDIVFRVHLMPIQIHPLIKL